MHVGVRAKTLACQGLLVGPSKLGVASFFALKSKIKKVKSVRSKCSTSTGCYLNRP